MPKSEKTDRVGHRAESTVDGSLLRSTSAMWFFDV